MNRKAFWFPTEGYGVIWVQRQASLDRQNFGVSRNCFICFLLFSIVAHLFWFEIFLVVFYLCKRVSQCREFAEGSSDLMKNMSHGNDEKYNQLVFGVCRMTRPKLYSTHESNYTFGVCQI